MRQSRLYKRHVSLLTAVTMTLGLGLATLSSNASATAAFARSTGASCTKCHSTAFPRLNARGENFMRNGFQLRKQDQEVTISGIEGDKPADESYKIADDLILKRVSEMFSVTGQIIAFQKESKLREKTLGKLDSLELLATGTATKDVPIWAEVEILSDGTVELDNYFVGMTNIGDSTLANVKIGSLDPTKWTSFPESGRGIDSGHSHTGAYRGNDGFSKIGIGYDNKSAIEYYGYNDRFVWAAAVANPGGTEQALDYWAVGRVNFLEGSSASLLYYEPNNPSDTSATRMYTLSGNYRKDALDLKAQYSWDNAGNGTVGDANGYTVQADYLLQKRWLGQVRYDGTDNGAAVDSKEAQGTVALVYAPAQNLRFTAAYVKELKSSTSSATYPAKNDVGSVMVRFMF